MKGRYRSKYGAKKTKVDGITFDSKREAVRYQELCLLQKAGEIRNLKLQVPFCLNSSGGSHVGFYVADFTYEEKDAMGLWCKITEDVKGVKTDLYRWKARHMLAQYGISIRET